MKYGGLLKVTSVLTAVHRAMSEDVYTAHTAKQFNLAALTSPVHRSDGGLSSPVISQSRKRDASVAGLDASPGSNESADQNDGDEQQSRKRPVKRACNECRQQKVRL